MKIFPKIIKVLLFHLLEGTDNGPDKIVDIIIDIKERNPSLEQGDIAVIFLDAGGYIYEYIHSLKSKVKQQLGWGFKYLT
ncbi:DNA/RNA helicase [Salmonella enterica subsp. enterica]|uniref:DNA/RNA helicase n=1 Tax=Salmonella enterica I TaxID=59201 RepID=A0A3S4IHR0_SALET|nr:DNA/RNA helicase [Salmonella enterica subsp. enterica]